MDSPAPPLFVYGTLMDADLLAAVIGRARGTSEPASLGGWEVVALPDRPYPGLRRAEGTSAEGLVVFGLERRDLDRLTAYEGDEYHLAYLTAVLAAPDGGPRNVAVAAYLPVIPPPPKVAAWSFADWRRDHKGAALAERAAQQDRA